MLPLLAAPFIGSFLGVLIRRLPAGRPVAMARSACETCGRTLQPAEMVPLLSHAFQRGRCRGCSVLIGRFHWIVELAAVAVALMVVASAPPEEVWADCALGWTLLALGWIDWEHQRLPDALTLPLVVAGLGVTWVQDPDGLLDHAVGAVLGYAAFRLISNVYRASRGHDGLGHGDAKLLAAAGAWVGLSQLNQVVLLGALATIGVVLWQARGKGLSGRLASPFGPGLAIALMVVRLRG